MSILPNLSQEDREALHTYICHYGGGSINCNYNGIPLGKLDYFLRYWDTAKRHLYKMFGNQFIIKKPIAFERDLDELANEMYKRLFNQRYGIIRDFINEYKDAVEKLVGVSSDDKYSLQRLATDCDLLVSNIYDGPNILISGENTVDGRPLQINHGCKIVKMLGKIVNSLGCNTIHFVCPECGSYSVHPTSCCGVRRVVITGFEKFRQEHAMALNQKVIRGNLCLSIHPLDYITISDNTYGWSSCMEWMEGAGDYRLGTIEMMNSPYIVVAYIENGEQICIGPYRWNSKRWRQLVVVTPELILGNKQYPYENDLLQGTALRWMRELAETNVSYGPYAQEASQIMNHTTNIFGKSRVSVNLHFCYMYNDIYDHRMGFLRKDFDEPFITYNLSGPAICTECGDEIDYESVDASWTVCRACSGLYQCAYCGSWQDDEPYVVDDNYYCDYCYHHNLDECEVCGSMEPSTYLNTIYIRLLDTTPEDDMDSYNWSYMITVCGNCFDSTEFKQLFGEIDIVQDYWSMRRTVVRIDNITDEGFLRGNIGDGSREMLRQIRDEKDPVARRALITKNFF